LILAAILARVGADPFVDGLRETTPAAIGAALIVTLVTTACCAWRWSLVAARLGTSLPVRAAGAAYYRSQFINATLPGGVLGDVHRAVRHGRDSGQLGLGVRGVAWERVIGLAVHCALAVLVVTLLPSSLRTAALTVIAAAAAAAVVVAVMFSRPLSRARTGRRLARAVATDVRAIFGAGPGRWGIVLVSAAAAVGHLAIFVVAARAAGVTTPTAELVPVAMIVLTATAIPMNVAGWGPREAVAAGSFGAIGLTADQGVTVAVVYGVLALVATSPGAVLLLLQRPQRPRTVEPDDPTPAPVEVATTGGTAHG
jgi:uncharacterized membrane protein YbhN (UPF0104 family)